MDYPQEPDGARIIPLFPHLPRDGATASSRRDPARPNRDDARTSLEGARDVADHLLGIDAISEPLPGEESGMTHVRSVELAASSGAFFPHVPTEDVPEAAARLGITTIEVMLQTASEYQPGFIKRLAANVRAAGVTIHSVHTMASLHPMLDVYPRRADEGRALFRQGIEATAALDASVLVWHGPRREHVATDEGWERFLALSHELANDSGEAGVTLALENTTTGALPLVRNVVNFASRLREIGSQKEIGFVFDPFQAAEAGANPFMMLAAMGNRVVNVHISDFKEDDPSARHLPPGDGDLPWPALIRAIAGSGYSGPMMIEGPLGENGKTMTRIREQFTPLIRSVFPFSPDEHRHDDDAVTIQSALPAGVRQGIALFNKRRFFEQHEVIEHEWHAERGPVRKLYQGILQIGVGFYHALNGNHKGAVSLLTDGIEKTSAFRPRALGIDTARLVDESQRCLDQIIALGPDRMDAFDASLIPTIVLEEA